MTIEGDELARRLRQAREAAGLTQDSAATALGLARPAIVQIEKGARTVSGLELDRLARLYGTEAGALLRDGDASVHAMFRKDDLADVPDVAAALEKALQIGRDLTALEEAAGLERGGHGSVAYDLPTPRTIHQAVAHGARTAEAERRRMGLGEEPIGDLVDLLEGAGVRLCAIDMPEWISGAMVVDGRAGTLIAINRRDHALRRTFSLAHEYGHALLDRVGGAIVSRTGVRGDLREIRANAFAAAFLIPEAGLRRRLGEIGKDAVSEIASLEGDERRHMSRSSSTEKVRLHDVASLAHAFGVSRLAMLNRLRAIRTLTAKRFDELRGEDAVRGNEVAKLLALPEADHLAERMRFDRRYARLALDAHAAGRIGRDELLRHLVDNLGLERAGEMVPPA